jgi:hypothetical protein
MGVPVTMYGLSAAVNAAEITTVATHIARQPRGARLLVPPHLVLVAGGLKHHPESNDSNNRPKSQLARF